MNLRYSILPIALAASMAFAAPGTPPPAASVLASAEYRAGQEHKNVLVLFHASWCGWCKQLDKTLERPDVQPIIDRNFKIVKLTIMESDKKKNEENPGGMDELKQLGGKEDGGIPFFAIVDPSNKLVANSAYSADGKAASNMGYPNAPSDITYFLHMMDEGAPNMTPGDRETLKKALEARAAEINAMLKAGREKREKAKH